MITLIIESQKSSKDKDSEQDSENYILNTNISNEKKVCEAYSTNKDGFLSSKNRITDGTIKPEKIINFNYKFYKKGKKTKIPSRNLKDLWDNLILDDEVKFKAVDYILYIENLCKTTKNIKELGINRSILIEGPPGVGKSTLARAISQKVSIRSKPFYLYEVNCSTVFSKFYGESQQRIDNIFKEIKTKRSIIIIDEVESILISRQKSIESCDPLDSIRAVNSFLTNLDKLKKRKHFYFIFTSNFSNQLDSAFLDRIDIKIKITEMTEKVKYKFVANIMENLMNNRVISSEKISDYSYEKLNENDSFMLNFLKEYKIESARSFKQKIVENLIKRPKTWRELLKFVQEQ